MFGHGGALGLVAGDAQGGEPVDEAEVAHLLLAAQQGGVLVGAVEVVPAQVVAAAFEQRDLDGHAQGVAHGGQVAVEELVLQGLGACGHDDLAALDQRGHEVGSGLAHAGAGFQHHGAGIADGRLHGLRHLDLLAAFAVAIEGAGQRAGGREQFVQRVRVHGAVRLHSSPALWGLMAPLSFAPMGG